MPTPSQTKRIPLYQVTWELARRGPLFPELAERLQRGVVAGLRTDYYAFRWEGEPDPWETGTPGDSELGQRMEELQVYFVRKYGWYFFLRNPAGPLCQQMISAPPEPVEGFSCHLYEHYLASHRQPESASHTELARAERDDNPESVILPDFSDVPHEDEEPRPLLHVIVDLSCITQWDLTTLSHEFKREVKRHLELIARLEKGYGSRAGPKPANLMAFHKMHPETFARDLGRYDLSQRESLTCREIALREEQGRDAESASPAPRAPIRKHIQRESSVHNSVRQIYEAIHRRPFTARRRRLDHPAEGVRPYSCPEHERDCPLSCTHLKTWMAKVEPTLPSDFSGS